MRRESDKGKWKRLHVVVLVSKGPYFRAFEVVAEELFLPTEGDEEREVARSASDH